MYDSFEASFLELQHVSKRLEGSASLRSPALGEV